jgi:restriction endonuclease S subunit
MSWLQRNISDIAIVSSGIPFRTRIENEPEGRIAVIQARDLSETGQVQVATSARVRSLPGLTEASLRTGDVLLQPRGTRFSVGVLVDQPILVAAAAPLLVLRCDPEQIDPEFLVLFLQLPRTQAVLRNAAVGTYIPQVPRSVVAGLSVDVPDLASQRKLVEFDRMKRREAELTAQLTARRERLLELAVRELAKKDRGHL